MAAHGGRQNGPRRSSTRSWFTVLALSVCSLVFFVRSVLQISWPYGNVDHIFVTVTGLIIWQAIETLFEFRKRG